MRMFLDILILFVMIESSLSTTSIKTYPTVNLTENVPINTKVIQLIGNEHSEMRSLKLILLNLGGFETNLFEIRNESIYTINEIDREQFVGEKRCFDRSYCLIEVHILVNDGEQYWVIPIHILDENDNKPQFRRSSIELKFSENNLNEYKMLFEGAIDYDEGINNKIYYVLDCSMIKNENLIRKQSFNESLINCSPLFQLKILSQSLINQYDQLALQYNPSLSSLSEYEFILYAFNLNQNKEKELINSMLIKIKIEKSLEKPKFVLSEYKFLIKEKENVLFRKEKYFIGQIKAKSNDQRNKLIYKIINQTNDIEINSLTGELFLLNGNSNWNEMNLLIESFYLINPTLKSFIKVKIMIRLVNELNEILINYQNQSLLINQLNNSKNEFLIKNKNKNLLLNRSLFNLLIKLINYPSDQLILSLLNYDAVFSFSSFQKNNYLLKLQTPLQSNSIYLLTIQVKHQLTNEYLSNLTIKLIINDDNQNESLSTICLENSTFILSDFNRIDSPIGKLKVIKTNLNLLSLSTFSFSKLNSNEIIFNDKCRMRIEELNENVTLNNQFQYQLCSLSNSCFNISFIENNNQKQHFQLFKRLLTIRPIEITILTFSLVFILATITLTLIICRLRGFHLCLSIKNYLFYGKKYGLNRAQRLSSTKIKERVQSIVVRESRSPSITPKSYIFNINQFLEQETIPSINLYSQSSSSPSHLPTSLSCTASLQRGQRTTSNVDHEATPRTISSSSVVQETKQLLEMITSNQDLDLSRLASEV